MMMRVGVDVQSLDDAAFKVVVHGARISTWAVLKIVGGEQDILVNLYANTPDALRALAAAAEDAAVQLEKAQASIDADTGGDPR